MKSDTLKKQFSTKTRWHLVYIVGPFSTEKLLSLLLLGLQSPSAGDAQGEMKESCSFGVCDPVSLFLESLVISTSQ